MTSASAWYTWYILCPKRRKEVCTYGEKRKASGRSAGCHHSAGGWRLFREKCVTEAAKDEAAPFRAEIEKEEETTPEGMEKEARAAAGPGAEDGGAAESEAGDKDIEAFAELVQEAVADRDMEALADLAAFPLNLETADGEKMTFADRNEFLKQNPDLIFGDDLMVAIAGVDTATLEVNADGVTMGEENPHIRYKKTEDGTFRIMDIRE